jgi:hypothetical protein
VAVDVRIYQNSPSPAWAVTDCFFEFASYPAERLFPQTRPTREPGFLGFHRQQPALAADERSVLKGLLNAAGLFEVVKAATLAPA